MSGGQKQFAILASVYLHAFRVDLRSATEKLRSRVNTIYFKSKKHVAGGTIGWLALGAHNAIDQDGTHLLTRDSTTVAQLEGYANGLKRMIDDAVKAAKQKLAP